jgi:phosphoribosylaminoimidazole-succinocarboxamide synthase
MATETLLQTNVSGFRCRRGKVRDVYDVGETLIIIATDRISAFDWVMATGIPDKGRILTSMSVFWFNWLGVPHHLLGTDLTELPPAFRTEELAGRTMHVRKTQVVPVECVARGYLAGSGWKEYRASCSRVPGRRVAA